MKTSTKILVVDDDLNLRKTLVDILRVKRYETVAAGTGREAISAADLEPIALALIDLKLPDMSGIQVMEHLKAKLPLLETIILTGHASMDTAIEAINKGAFSYLLKPYQMEEVLLHIRHGIEKRQAQDEIMRLASHPRLNPNPVIEIDRNARLSYLNPAAERLFPDLSSLGLEHPLMAGLTDLLTSEETQGDTSEVVRQAHLQEAVYELHLSYVTEADLVRVYAIDITERTRAQSVVEQLRRDLELILNSAGEGIVTLNEEGNHTLVNPAALSMLGYEAAELLDRHSHLLWHHSKQDGGSYPESECPIYQTLAPPRCGVNSNDWAMCGNARATA